MWRRASQIPPLCLRCCGSLIVVTVASTASGSRNERRGELGLVAGIEYRDTDAFIDEIPAAYKPIDQVHG